MFFSIIIPVYNVEKYLEECIESVIHQVISLSVECEILLIDDGSTDFSGDICDKYQISFPGMIKVFHNKNQGLLLTRRFGYKYASGKYIINCDSDDKFEDGALKKLKDIIESYNNPDVIFFNYCLYDGIARESAYKNIFADSRSCIVSKENVLEEFLLHHSIVSVCGKCYKRKCIDIGKDYSDYAQISNGEDSLQTIEILDRANSFIYLNEILYIYRIGSGMTRRYDSNYYLSFKKIIKQIENRKEKWLLSKFDELVAVKFLATTGRAVTQSRFKKWSTFKSQKRYLEQIREDDMFKQNIIFLKKVKGYLQKDHLILLFLLKKKCYTIEIILLRIKNSVEALLRPRA